MRLALRLFWRDWRGGEIGVLLLSVALSVGIVTTLGMFVERLQRVVDARSATFLAGDIVLRAPRPVPREWLDAAQAAGLRRAEVLRFASMAMAGARMQLVSAKAVDDNYPLLGTLDIASAPGDASRSVAHGPAPGELWVDARLLTALGVAVGDRVGIGATTLRIGAILRREPDGAGSVVALGPRVVMHTADLAAAQVIQPGSRVQYAWLFTGEEAAIARWRADIEPRLLPSQRIVTVKDAQPELAHSLDNARSFLLLAGSLGVVMAGIALAMAAYRYTQRHADYVAILKTLGLGAPRIRVIYLGNLALLAMGGIALGWLVGWAVQALAFVALADLFDTRVPPAGTAALMVGAGTGAVSLLALAAPALLRLAGASPLRVLRREVREGGATLAPFALGAVALLALLYWYGHDLRLGLLVIGCLLLVAAGIGGFSYALLRRARLPGVQAHSAVRLAVAGLQRHARLNALQMLVFALCLMLALLMLLVRTALIEDWRRELPPGTPNHFLVNIAPYQLQDVEAFLASHGIHHAGIYPMVAGRVLLVNGQPARVREGETLNIEREFNLTWSDALPSDNRILAGRWWTPDADGEASVEESVARGLGLAIGDRLTIQIGADRFEVRLTSIRALDWNSMRPNFYVMFPRQTLARYTGTSITSFYLAPAQKVLLNELVQRFPTLSVLEMDALLAQLRTISAQLAQAVELVLVLLLVAGLLVMVASVQSGLDERFQESAILRAIGAGRGLVLGSLVLEFMLLGMLAGVIAAVGAELAAWYVQTRLMELAFRLHPLVWLAGPVAGALLAAALGVASCRKVVDTPPMDVLREVM